jgi:hypothetical protein
MSMGAYKGMPLVLVRQWAAQARVEGKLYEGLSPEDQRQLRIVMATSWVPVELATRVFLVAAPLLFAADPAPLRRLGRELAADNFRGVFRYVAQLSSVEGLLNRTALFWRAYHDQGQAQAHRVHERLVRFEVTGYPGLPERMRETICGWLAHAIELTGATQVSVTKSDENEQIYRWAVSWR